MKHRYGVVVIAASAGGVQALQKLLSALPPDFPLPIAVVQHRTGNPPNLLARVLGRHTALTVKTAEQGEALAAGTVYLAPPRQHLIVRADETLALFDGHKIRHVHSSANPLFASAAQVYGDGVQSVKQRGGVVLAQDEATSMMFAMPQSAIQTGAVRAVLPLGEIAPEILRLARLLRPSAESERAPGREYHRPPGTETS